MIEDVRIEPDAALPGDRRRLRIDADPFELAHIAPQLEGTDLEEIAEEHAALEAVLETQPQPVVLFRLARGHSVHLAPVLLHGFIPLCLVPTQRAAGLILDDAGFEEIALLLE